MSMAKCEGCGRIVDTDEDGEFYFITKENSLDRIQTDGFCEKCRGEA